MWAKGWGIWLNRYGVKKLQLWSFWSKPGLNKSSSEIMFMLERKRNKVLMCPPKPVLIMRCHGIRGNGRLRPILLPSRECCTLQECSGLKIGRLGCDLQLASPPSHGNLLRSHLIIGKAWFRVAIICWPMVCECWCQHECGLMWAIRECILWLSLKSLALGWESLKAHIFTAVIGLSWWQVTAKKNMSRSISAVIELHWVVKHSN